MEFPDKKMEGQQKKNIKDLNKSKRNIVGVGYYGDTWKWQSRLYTNTLYFLDYQKMEL